MKSPKDLFKRWFGSEETGEVVHAHPNAKQSDSKGGRSAMRTVSRVLLAVVFLFLPLYEPVLTPALGLLVAVAIAINNWRRIGAGMVFLTLLFVPCLYTAPFVIMLAFVAPLSHARTVPLWYNLPVGQIMVLSVVVGVGALLSAGCAYLTRSPKFKSRNRITLQSVVWLLVLAASGGVMYFNHQEDLKEWQLARVFTSDLKELKHLPKTIDRLMPQITAKQLIKTKNKENIYVVADHPHLAPGPDGKIYWRSPLYFKDDLWYNLTGMVRTVVSVDSNLTDMRAFNADEWPNAKEGDGFFWFGDQSWMVKGAFMLRHPFSEISRAIYIHTHDGQWLFLISYESRCPSKTGAMVPCAEGVLSVNKYGWIRDFSMTAAGEEFSKAPVYPPALARLYVQAYAKFYNGLVDKTVNQQKQVMEISQEPKPDVLKEEDYNPAPYIEEFEGIGLQEVAALAPAGTNGTALTALVLVDASDGRPSVFKVTQGNGPTTAEAYAHNADPQVDWGQKLIPEARPVVGDNDHICWSVSVVNDNARYPLYLTSLVESIRLDAYPVHSADEMAQLVKEHCSGPLDLRSALTPPLPVALTGAHLSAGN
jgi:hypothetical protein